MNVGGRVWEKSECGRERVSVSVGESECGRERELSECGRE